MTINELLERHPLPWKFVVEKGKHGRASYDLGSILDKRGDSICYFGDETPYDSGAGCTPERDVMDLLLSLVNGLKPSV